MTHTTNYVDTFIAVSDDSRAIAGTVPPEKPENPSVAARTFRMISENPYRFTSDDVVFGVWADRNGVPDDGRAAARAAFFCKGQACLRASDLAKKYGWGIHHDAEGRIALYGVDSEEYERFVSGEMTTADGAPVVVKKAMRSKRG